VRRAVIFVGAVVVVAGACSDRGGDELQLGPFTTVGVAGPDSTASPDSTVGAATTSATGSTPVAPTLDDRISVAVDVAREIGPISPLIRGVSGGVDAEFLEDVGATANSWGGNPSTRFNYEIGHAWNAGADWEYRNGNYDQRGDAARQFIVESHAGGAAVRLAVPTLGWIARNDDNNTCSFPTAGGCDGGAGLTCERPGTVADPSLANVPSTPEMVRAWITRLVDAGLSIEFVAMDNEPELWGHSHYDVHPSCTTYEEVLSKYLAYADVIREIAPDAQLLGPVACCWYDYWGVAPGAADDRDADYLTWFLDQVRRHDERVGGRSLDLVDVHYYPQSDVYNDETDPQTAARRLRSTRSLWDPTYVDESWIDEPIQFIRRMKKTIAANYPGTGLAISEWNFGADATMNGALAIADVLGIYGREGVQLATYWRHPPAGSPGYFAFKLHGNYDGQGSSFDGVAVETTTSDGGLVVAYAATDDDVIRVMLINKSVDRDLTVPVRVEGAAPEGPVNLYRYSEAVPTGIVHEQLTAAGDPLAVDLPASSITVVELTV
jgi:Glycoside hydrolase family 44